MTTTMMMSSFTSEECILVGLIACKKTCNTVRDELQRLFDALALQNGDVAAQELSQWRGLEQQLKIWEQKISGERAVRDDLGQILPVKTMSEWELANGICLFSAIPGASRHHWGTDADIYDGAAFSRDPSLQLQLTRDEYLSDGGPNRNLFLGLQSLIKNVNEPSIGQSGFGESFYWPYDCYRGGVAIEPWHLSYFPRARECQAAYTFELFKKILNFVNFPLAPLLRKFAPYFFRRYVINNAYANAPAFQL